MSDPACCVSGLSKGKRLLSWDVAEQYVTLGSEMKETGNRAFAAQDYDMALTRHVIHAQKEDKLSKGCHADGWYGGWSCAGTRRAWSC